MTKRINNKLWDNFIILIKESKNTKNHYYYYKSIISFLNENKKFIRKELFSKCNLYFFMELDAKSYVNEKSELDLEKEKIYVENKPSCTEEFIRDIKYKLEKMIFIESNRECPCCHMQGIMIYFIDTVSNNIILQCDSCYYQEDIYGNKINILEHVRPANKYDLKNTYKIEELWE